jgi:hypothetical protein
LAAIDEPFNIANGDPGDADAVMANFNTIVNAINGGLELGSNVKAAAPTATIMGNTSSPGTSVSALRADAQFTLQGFENSSSDPSSSNFVGRTYYNTVNNQMRLCIATAGAGTWVSMGNPLATELVLHAAQHADGAADQLTDTSVAARSRKSQTPAVIQLGSDVTSISTSTFTTIADLAVTTTGVQTLAVIATLNFKSQHATNKPNVFVRVRDHTAADVTIYRSNYHQMGNAGSGSDVAEKSYCFYYTVPATGARTLRLQAGCDIAQVDVRAQLNPGSDTTAAVSPTMTAVII